MQRETTWIVLLIWTNHRKNYDWYLMYPDRTWIVMVLPHRKNISPHPDTLCSFRAKQCLLVHLNLAFLAKKQYIRMCLVFGFTRLWLEPTTYLTRTDHTSHYTSDVVYFYNFLFDFVTV